MSRESDIVRKSADATMPEDYYARDTVTGAELIVIPATFTKDFIDFHAEGQDVYLRFGDIGVADPAIAARSGLDGSGNLSLDGQECLRVPADHTISVRVRSSSTHFKHISAAGGGVLRFYNTTGPGEE